MIKEGLPTVSEEVYQELCRVQALESKRTQTPVSLSGAVESSVKGYLLRKDPVMKAHRAQVRHQKKARASQVVARETTLPKTLNSKRIPLTARKKHLLYQKTQGRCTHIDIHGRRCDNNRWIEAHHIRRISESVGNELENLTHLCSNHHGLVHQLSLPIEGQVSWLRSPSREYELRQVH